MANYYNVNSWVDSLRKLPLLDISRDDCLSQNFDWDQWRSQCLRRFAIWSSRAARPVAATVEPVSSPPSVLLPTIKLTPQFAEEVDQVLESRAVTHEDATRMAKELAEEWDETFIFYVVPSVSVVVICICIAICSCFIIDHFQRRRKHRCRPGARAETTAEPVAVDVQSSNQNTLNHRQLLMTLSGAERPPQIHYVREESILSNVSYPPPYSLVDGHLSSDDNATESVDNLASPKIGLQRVASALDSTHQRPPPYETVVRAGQSQRPPYTRYSDRR